MKSNTAKRVLALLLALTMILGLGMGALASTPVQNIPGSPGLGVVPPALVSPGSNTLTIHHHGWDTPVPSPIPDADLGRPSGPPRWPTYTDQNAPRVGAIWHVRPVTTGTNAGEIPADFDVTSTGARAFINNLVPDGSGGWGFVPNAPNAGPGGSGWAQTTDSQGRAIFADLPNGIYVAWPADGSVTPFLIHLPIWYYPTIDITVDCGVCPECINGDPCSDPQPGTSTGAGQWLDNVHVFVKETPPEEPNIDKLIEMTEGNFARWAIEIEIMEDLGTLRPLPVTRPLIACGTCPECLVTPVPDPCSAPVANPFDLAFTGAAPHIRVIDVLDPRLSLTTPTADAVRVYFWHVANEAYVELPQTIGPDTLWEIQTPTINSLTTVIVDITTAGRNHIALHGVYVCLANDPATPCPDYPNCELVMGNIRVVIDTEMDLTDTDRLYPDHGPIVNQAQVFYGDQPTDRPYDELQHFHLDLWKIDVRSTPLYGAGFQLFTQWQINPATGLVWGQTAERPLTHNWNVYDAADLAAAQTAFRAAHLLATGDPWPAGMDPLPTTLAPVATINMPATGPATFWNALGQSIVQGLTEGNYFLYEFVAPAGFNRITTAQQVVVNMAMARSNDPLVTADYRIVEARVTNSSDFDLPLAGGAGQLIFTVVGLLLIGGAALILIISKKRRSY